MEIMADKMKCLAIVTSVMAEGTVCMERYKQMSHIQFFLQILILCIGTLTHIMLSDL